MFTEKTVAWCRQHDWGTDAVLLDGRICALREVTIEPDGFIVETRVSFTDRSRLKIWAGY